MGERAKNIGEEAETKVWNFINSLGYTIHDTNNEEYDIDCIAKAPSQKPLSGLALPRYATAGLTAFEVRESSVSQKKIQKFRNKILKFNSDNPDGKIVGGIYLVDRRISKSVLDMMVEEKIMGWGVRRQRLYREKIRTHNIWKERNTFIVEKTLDTTCSYILCSTPPPTSLKQLLHVFLFFDDPFHKLTPKRLRSVMEKIMKSTIKPLLNIGVKPINIFFESHSIGGLSKRLIEEMDKTIVVPWKAESVNIYPNPTYPFRDYRAFTTL